MAGVATTSKLCEIYRTCMSDLRYEQRKKSKNRPILGV